MVSVSRDIQAIMIPDGTVTQLKEGTRVSIHQALGGTYTLGTEHGFMVRISTSDADAIGETPEDISIQPKTNEASDVKDAIWKVLKTVYDPEIPVNIVDLGLVYECHLEPISTDKFNVKIQMTLTAPGCGMGPVLQADVELRIKDLNPVEKVNVEVVLDPPWDREMMSEAARLELGLM